MVQIRVTGCQGGAECRIEALAGRPLMEALRDADSRVLGTCGGECMCGTCHVYIDPAAADRLPPRSEAEQMMLEAIGEVVEIRPNSRLSCQLLVTDGFDGMSVEIGPIP